MFKARIASLVAASSMSLAVSTAFAQQPAGSSAGVGAGSSTNVQDAGQNEEIVVTAQRRSQSLKDVGISINVASGEKLNEVGVTNTSALQKIVPALNVTPANTGFSGTPIYTLRGVGFNERSLSGLSAVAVYQDEIPMTYPYETSGPLFDLQRVEVLKGPQGTLYGQNSTGGSINYISRRPSSTFTAGGEASYESFNNLDLQGYVSGPISDTIAVRLSGRYINSDGWQRSVTRPGDRLGASDLLGGRFLLDWKPSDKLKIQINLNGWRDHSETPAPQVIGLNPSLLDFFAGPYSFQSAVVGSLKPNPTIRDTDWTPGLPYRNRTRFLQGTIRADYRLTDKITLTSLSTLTRFRLYSPRDVDGNAADLDSITTTGNIHSFNQEMRAAYEHDHLHVIVGGTYAKDRVIGGDQELPQGLSTGQVFGALIGVPKFTAGRTLSTSNRENYAAFANTDFDMASGLTFTGGVRYTHTKLSNSACFADNGDGVLSKFFSTLLVNPAQIPNPAGAGQCQTISGTVVNGTFVQNGQGAVQTGLTEDNVSFRAGVNYHLNADTLIYGLVSRGFKSGNVPSIAAFLNTQLQPVKQEELTAYEIGAKVSFGRLLQVNVAAFHYDYKDKQLASLVVIPLGFLAEQTINIPKSRVNGAEIEATLRPMRGLELRGGGSLTNTKVLGSTVLPVPFTSTTFPFAPGFVVQGTADVGGQPINLAPKWQANGDAEYRFPVGNSLEAAIGGSVSYASATAPVLGAPRSTYLDAHTVFDARIGIRNERAGWRAQIFGRNIFNENYAVAVSRGADTTLRYPGMPATFGITLGLDLR